jgi:hypothetical protein
MVELSPRSQRDRLPCLVTQIQSFNGRKWGPLAACGTALSVLFVARKEEDAMQVLRFGLVCLVATLMGTSLGRAENLECSCLCSNGVDALCIIDGGDQELGSVLETTTNYGLVAKGKDLFLFSQCANPFDVQCPTTHSYKVCGSTTGRMISRGSGIGASGVVGSASVIAVEDRKPNVFSCP